MGKGRIKFADEEKIFNDITSPNSTVKDDINKIIKNDIKLIAKNESQKKIINSIKNNEITIVAGPSGSGKTFVAVAYALNLLKKSSSQYKKIYLVKSVTTLKGEEIGYIKGDFQDKITPFMWSYYINIEKLISEITLKILIEKEIIKPFPLAYMRGASLDNCIIIADELQNISLDNSLTLLTRIGSNSKIIALGDTNQIDLKNKHDSSLNLLLNLFENTENIGVIKMDEKDINVRNPIITIIEKKFKEHYSKLNKKTKQLITESNGD
jgi:phosphate starvation-inducible PhoH-like protein